jgi:hypothetical protein
MSSSGNVKLRYEIVYSFGGGPDFTLALQDKHAMFKSQFDHVRWQVLNTVLDCPALTTLRYGFRLTPAVVLQSPIRR